jgi:hypothetical protein
MTLGEMTLGEMTSEMLIAYGLKILKNGVRRNALIIE